VVHPKKREIPTCNTPSPAVAAYRLRQAVAKSDEDVKSFVCDDFYVDDGLTSLTDKEQEIKLVKRTQKSLMDNGHIRLHKIVSNNVDVMKAFSTDGFVIVIQTKYEFIRVKIPG
jgi:hypothetical protein